MDAWPHRRMRHTCPHLSSTCAYSFSTYPQLSSLIRSEHTRNRPHHARIRPRPPSLPTHPTHPTHPPCASRSDILPFSHVLLSLQVIDRTQERHSFVFFFYPSFDAGIPAVPEDASAASRYSLLSSQVISYSCLPGRWKEGGREGGREGGNTGTKKGREESEC